MLLLLSMAFDEGNCNFTFHRCLFEYNGREYMLYAGTSENYMSIDTFVENEREADIVFEEIHKFLYLFGWVNYLSFHYLGSSLLHAADKSILVKRTGPLYTHPRRYKTQDSFDIITNPNASEDFKNAIALYNDAKHTDDIFYSFLCLYKIIDLPVNGKTRNPADWIKSNVHHVVGDWNPVLRDYVNGKPDFGRYIQDECRNALEHIHRTDPDKSSILPFRLSDYQQIEFARSIMLE